MLNESKIILLPSLKEFTFKEIQGGIEKKALIDLPDYFHKVLNFCYEWLNDKNHFSVNTSGSTGKARKISLSRKIMEMSALKTNDYFNLQAGMNIFLPLSVDHIAGKMMLVRAMMGHLHCYVAEAQADIAGLFENISSKNHLVFDFSVMVPLQLDKLLQTTHPSLINITFPCILLGGSSISPQLETKIQKLKSNIHLSYGMTETASHVALRKLNGEDKQTSFHPLKGITIQTDSEQRLLIKGDITNGQTLQTNDVGECFKDQYFVVLGRSDTIINSGGIKINPETIESYIFGIISNMFKKTNDDHIHFNYLISAQNDAVLGQKCIFVTDNPNFNHEHWEFLIRELRKQVEFSATMLPKNWHFINKLPTTTIGKFKRIEIITILNNIKNNN
ncbi:MAG: AMP-binding protein [Candidatus Marinimicrobia bacterium]|nr:AMP-binding protein [Candidatus Neomarinimicrobiota bacterium]